MASLSPTSAINRCRHQPAEDGTQGETSNTNPMRRRKRTVLSCDTCRRLKCRCVWELGHDACKRCRALRLKCYKPGSQGEGPSRGRSDESLTTSSDQTEQRLQKVEEALDELKTLIGEGTQHTSTVPPSSRTVNSIGSTRNYASEDNRRVVASVDKDVPSCPAEVVRNVNKELHGERRRVSEYEVDLITQGLLDPSTASDSVSTFVRHRKHILLIEHENDMAMGKDLVSASPFLHTVCCLGGLRTYLRFGGGDSSLHRDIYERARHMLGQLMLVGPLPLEEITGILIMAMFATSPTHGPEYIDSWLLSGHCAQQAMLSIRFSDIAARVQSSSSTLEDHRSLRVWCLICLTNLQWATTTARPSTIPAAYIDQCKLLLNFEQATLRDSMVVAEIELLLSVHELCTSKEHLGGKEGSAILEAWKCKWGHLLDLPSARTLKLSFPIAGFILTRRSLDHARDLDDLGSSVQWPNNPRYFELEMALCQYAVDVLSAYVTIPRPVADCMPEFYLLCVVYSLIILSKYGERLQASAKTQLRHIVRSMCNSGGETRIIPPLIQFGIRRVIRANDLGGEDDFGLLEEPEGAGTGDPMHDCAAHQGNAEAEPNLGIAFLETPNTWIQGSEELGIESFFSAWLSGLQGKENTTLVPYA